MPQARNSQTSVRRAPAQRFELGSLRASRVARTAEKTRKKDAATEDQEEQTEQPEQQEKKPQQAHVTPKSAPNNKPNTSKHGAKNPSKIGPTSTPNRPNIDPKSTKNRCPAGFQHNVVFCDPFCTLFSNPKIVGGASWDFTQYFFRIFQLQVLS